MFWTLLCFETDFNEGPVTFTILEATDWSTTESCGGNMELIGSVWSLASLESWSCTTGGDVGPSIGIVLDSLTESMINWRPKLLIKDANETNSVALT